MILQRRGVLGECSRCPCGRVKESVEQFVHGGWISALNTTKIFIENNVILGRYVLSGRVIYQSDTVCMEWGETDLTALPRSCLPFWALGTILEFFVQNIDWATKYAKISRGEGGRFASYSLPWRFGVAMVWFTVVKVYGVTNGKGQKDAEMTAGQLAMASIKRDLDVVWMTPMVRSAFPFC